MTNKYFCSAQVQQQNLLPMIFMPLALMDEKMLKKLDKDGVAVFFEEYSKAGPRSINGYPCFFSCRYMTFTDYEKVREVAQALQSAMDGVLKDTSPKKAPKKG